MFNILTFDVFSWFVTHLFSNGYTECPTIKRKSVLNLLKYRFVVYISRCCADLR